MLANDPDAIGWFMADEWTIVGPDGRVSGKAAFLELVRTGRLTHDVMESRDLTVRLYGETALVLGTGVSGGLYDGQAFHLTERQSNVFVKLNGRWQCVLTHLSMLSAR